ncbi:MAG: DEAD/DEAH box helicase [Candidatus Bipolaricaulaceae bacterium]
MARRRKNQGMPSFREMPSFQVQKPPSDITFVPPDSLLEPYPESCRINTQDLDIAQRRFKEYILNGVAWANEQRQSGNPYARFPSEALCVNNLRLEVKEWREKGYPDVTETTRFLLNFWFEYPRERVLWFSQREAVETLVYLYEVKRLTKVTELIERYGAFRLEGYFEYDRYPRYAFRMATGSGKTLVMALLSVWSFFNYLREDRERFTRFFLFVAPNIIVYDRLRRDLENLAIFDEFHLIPEEWKKDFRVRVVTRDTFSDADRFPPPEDEGVIFVTNIHQIGFRESAQRQKEDIVGALFGAPDPGKDPYKATSIKLWEILNHYPGILILKDEAHHIHREESRWQNYLWDLHDTLAERFSRGVFMELDFSATPKDERGALFPWIIVDFSLREALQTGIVKYPAKVVLHDAPPIKRGFDLSEFRPYIEAALDRWRKHRQKLRELGRKAVLFIMADEIENAEAIYEGLLKEPDITASNMILVHSELDEWKARMRVGGKDIVSKIRINGEEKELDRDLALKLVRGLDEPDNPIEVISSVMMLNEGWDVRSVTVILGLRSYASEREILPEQVIGRGLRKLFPDEGVDTERWVNVLEVVGPPKLLEVLDQLEQMEGIRLPEAPESEKFFVSFNPRLDAPEDMRFEIPKAEFVSFVEDVDLKRIVGDLFGSLPQGVFRRSEVEEFRKTYRYEVVSLSGRTLDRGEIETPFGAPVIPLYRLAEELEEIIPLPHAFSTVLEALEEYVRERLFDEPVDIDEDVLKFLYSKGWYGQVKQDIERRASHVLSDPSFASRAEIARKVRLEELEGFPWYRDFADSGKSLLVRIAHDGGGERRIPSCPVDNELEADFVGFLDRARDVVSFLKNVPHVVRLRIIYYDTREKKWRDFYPDFIVKTKEGFYLVETKGREEIQVPDKNAAARQWCEAVSEATGVRWRYLYLREGDWSGKESLQTCEF